MKNEILNLSYMDNYRVTCQTENLDPKQFSVTGDDKDAFRKKNIELKRYPVGQIQLPTGIICALDPLTLLDNAQAIRPSVPPGSYPVYFSIAEMVMNWPVVRNGKMSFEPSHDRRVAFAMIQFTEKHVTSWQPAYFCDQDESEIKEGEVYGYRSSSGKGCFMDRTLAEAIRQRYGKDFGYYDEIVSEMNKAYNTCPCTNLQFEKVSNLIAFSTGFGAGVYASYFGYGQNDEIVCLVTDFGIVRPMGVEKQEIEPYTPAGTERGLWVGTKYDWRVAGQEKHLKGAKLIRHKYRQNPRNPKWDHDHCSFCWVEFCLKEHCDSLKEGYATLDDYHWICPTCFDDFKDLFGWEVVPEPDA